jgi:phosphate transport system protein
MSMNPHISEQFDAEMARARDLLMEMGGRAEKLVHDATDALVNHDAELAQQVRDGDARVNQLEIEIDELCIHVIARRQPAASDLRALISIMKASTDIERIGDEAGRIAKMAQALSGLDHPDDQYRDFRGMAELALGLVARSLDAFAREDADAALEAIGSDDAVDTAYDAILRERSSRMRAGSSEIDRAMNVIWAARALERIGDHAKNISEYLVFQVRGQDVRHSGGAHTAPD